MCGFVGFTGIIENRETTLTSMMDRIAHRGPDMAGSFLDDNIALGFRRLSIIDLSEAGRQPMTNEAEDSSLVIVFNGEIYNYQALRAELIARGHRFFSHTDTEVLLHGYQEYGASLTDHLRGMFAFVIYDRENARLFGARDFFGIKPFYYTLLPDGGFLFGSEIKSFLEHPAFVKAVNPEALRPFLCFQYNALPETFFKGVFKLPQAHRFTYDLASAEMQVERFWDVDFRSEHMPLDACIDHLDQVINESVEAHRIADVPVGAYLSGGVDSSYITASMKPSKTFSVGFADEGFDETVFSRDFSDILGIENYRKMVGPEESFELFSTIQYHLDEPDSNPSVVPLYFLAQLAREQVTVVLSGEGGDEVFAGYDWYGDSPALRRYKKLPAGLRRGIARAAARLPYFKGQGQLIRGGGRPEDWFIGQAIVFEVDEATELLKPPYQHSLTPLEITAPHYARVQGADEIAKKQYLDLNLWQPGDILLKADKMSMAHSLELRVPFLDKVVMQTAETLPPEYKVAEGLGKYALRKAAAKTIPAEWADRVKLGFLTPVRNWLKDERFSSIVRGYLTSEYAAEFFDTDKLTALLDEHCQSSGTNANNARKVWTCFTFLVWYKRFFIDEPTSAEVHGTGHGTLQETPGSPAQKPTQETLQEPTLGKHRLIAPRPVTQGLTRNLTALLRTRLRVEPAMTELIGTSPETA
ncbi:MAG: asparagine synthase (glutamine-hydrolyzing) [Coriobacteriales bacterium]|jgi:asparagine synthase (glutamine-hydrolysing)|nr:asparagine synthase (glutamine-hydrolyzing) [Coriobacteriales bacterium]